MSDVKRYTDYGGMIDCETDELSGGATGTVYVKASDYDELRKQLEQECEKARKYQLIAGACLGGTDYADKIMKQSKHCYEAHDLAFKLHQERDVELIAASIKPCREQLEQAEARHTRLVTASRNAIRMWALAQNWISEKMRPTYKEWDAAMEEFEQALATSPASPQVGPSPQENGSSNP